METVNRNATLLGKQIRSLLSNGSHDGATTDDDNDDNHNDVEIVNNMDWLRSVSLLDFLRETGRYARVNEMMDRERFFDCTSSIVI